MSCFSTQHSDCVLDQRTQHHHHHHHHESLHHHLHCYLPSSLPRAAARPRPSSFLTHSLLARIGDAIVAFSSQTTPENNRYFPRFLPAHFFLLPFNCSTLQHSFLGSMPPFFIIFFLLPQLLSQTCQAEKTTINCNNQRRQRPELTQKHSYLCAPPVFHRTASNLPSSFSSFCVNGQIRFRFVESASWAREEKRRGGGGPCLIDLLALVTIICFLVFVATTPRHRDYSEASHEQIDLRILPNNDVMPRTKGRTTRTEDHAIHPQNTEEEEEGVDVTNNTFLP